MQGGFHSLVEKLPVYCVVSIKGAICNILALITSQFLAQGLMPLLECGCKCGQICFKSSETIAVNGLQYKVCL